MPISRSSRSPRHPRHRLLLALWVSAALPGCGSESPPPADAGPGGEALAQATFVGRDACLGCHEAEVAAWEGSHHDQALDVATDSTVLGDFDDATFTQHSITHRFFRRGDEFWVETEGPGGEMEEYPVTHVIGVEPLQQYLVPFPGGRLQTLPITWDSRSPEEGGQRWYHVYGDERIAPGDPLFWTGINQNWNYQCAECHSTDLRKNYRMGSDSFETSWEEIDVSCEACHGPASAHVERAVAAEAEGEAYAAPEGGDLQAALGPANPGTWTWSDALGRPVRSTPTGDSDQIDTCARCHARRGLETLDYEFGQAFPSTHRPALPRSPLYFHDGQILDEVYVYGSFLQSRMYQAGVLCSDCHEPHSNELLAPGPEVCARCHSPSVYSGPQHDFHPRPAGSVTPGGGVTRDPATWRNPDVPTCLDCHMRERTYMGVDDRGDHSFRIPRPDLSEETGAPDACTSCHQDREAAWAAAQVAAWYGPDRPGPEPNWGTAMALAAREGPGFAQALVAVAEDTAWAPLVRASAVETLTRAHPRHLLRVIGGAAADPDPLVRRAAMSASTVLLPGDRVQVAGPGLTDPVRGVRAAAGRSLAPLPDREIPEEMRGALEDAELEWVQAQLAAAEHPSAHANLGAYYAESGRAGEAETALRRTLAMDSTYVVAWANLADLYRVMGREGEAATVLEEGIRAVPDRDGAPLHYALGLLKVRQGRTAEALEELSRAAELDPDNPRYAYVQVVALNDLGQPERARTLLGEALQRNPWNRDLLSLAVSLAMDDGRVEEARGFASRLLERDPGDPDAQMLATQLGVAGPA